MLSVSDALQHIEATARTVPKEQVALADALGCTLADDCVAAMDSPPFDKALMDGFCLRSSDVPESAAEFLLPVAGCVTAGAAVPAAIQPGTAVQIMTGAPLPAGADVVVPIERTQPDGDPPRVVKLPFDAIRSESNVLRQGAITAEGERLVAAGRVIRAQEIAVLAESGYATVAARRVPRIAVLATGDELVPVGEPLSPGQIRNSNEPMVAAQIQSAGGESVPLGIARDNREQLAERIEAGLAADILLLTGGVSAGTKDLVPAALEAAGVRQVFHKVRMKPGKPLWFGVLERSDGLCLVFGLPGNPVSSMVCFEVFVRPAIDRLLGRAVRPQVAARLTVEHRVRGDRVVYWPCATQTDPQGTLLATPLPWKGSADLATPANADALAIFSPRDAAYTSGQVVELLVLNHA